MRQVPSKGESYEGNCSAVVRKKSRHLRRIRILSANCLIILEVCSFGKSYAGPRLGVRDVFQQLESAILWSPNAVRQRIVMIFNYLDPSGRAPRQITIPPNDQIMPSIDIRPFIDQGFWMIDTVYSYICHTGITLFWTKSAATAFCRRARYLYPHDAPKLVTSEILCWSICFESWVIWNQIWIQSIIRTVCESSLAIGTMPWTAWVSLWIRIRSMAQVLPQFGANERYFGSFGRL